MDKVFNKFYSKDICNNELDNNNQFNIYYTEFRKRPKNINGILPKVTY